MPNLENKGLQLPYHTRAVLFDLDDTLHYRDKAFRGWAQAFTQHYEQRDQKSHQELVDYLVKLDKHGYAPREDLFIQLKHDYPLVQGTIADIIDAYRRKMIEYIVLEQEIEILVHSLQDAHIPFGIVTNGITDLQKQKITRLGFDKFTTCIFISEEFGAAKPDPSIFRAAAQCLETRLEDVLFAGDNPRFDILGAHSVGMKTVWVHHNERKWPDDIPGDVANITVCSFAELLLVFGLTTRVDSGAEADDTYTH